MSTSVLQEIMELPKCEDESGCRWIKADDVFRVIDGHLKQSDRLDPVGHFWEEFVMGEARKMFRSGYLSADDLQKVDTRLTCGYEGGNSR